MQGNDWGNSQVASSALAFRERAMARLQSAARTSLGASNLRAAYMVWCAVHGHEPLSQQKLGAELTGLGFAKWKSCGLIRCRDLQLVA